MKKVKAVIFAAALVIGFTSLASTSSASTKYPEPCFVPCYDNVH